MSFQKVKKHVFGFNKFIKNVFSNTVDNGRRQKWYQVLGSFYEKQ